MPKAKRRGRKTFSKENRRKAPSAGSTVFISSSLNEIEDQKDLAFWNMVTRDAATKAINENKAMNIPVTVLEDGWVVRKSNDGTIEKVTKLEEIPLINQSYSLHKGSILHVKSN